MRGIVGLKHREGSGPGVAGQGLSTAHPSRCRWSLLEAARCQATKGFITSAPLANARQQPWPCHRAAGLAAGTGKGQCEDKAELHTVVIL